MCVRSRKRPKWQTAIWGDGLHLQREVDAEAVAAGRPPSSVRASAQVGSRSKPSVLGSRGANFLDDRLDPVLLAARAPTRCAPARRRGAAGEPPRAVQRPHEATPSTPPWLAVLVHHLGRRADCDVGTEQLDQVPCGCSQEEGSVLEGGEAAAARLAVDSDYACNDPTRSSGTTSCRRRWAPTRRRGDSAITARWWTSPLPSQSAPSRVAVRRAFNGRKKKAHSPGGRRRRRDRPRKHRRRRKHHGEEGGGDGRGIGAAEAPWGGGRGASHPSVTSGATTTAIVRARRRRPARRLPPARAGTTTTITTAPARTAKEGGGAPLPPSSPQPRAGRRRGRSTHRSRSRDRKREG